MDGKRLTTWVGRIWGWVTLLLVLAAVAFYAQHVFATFGGSTVDDSAISYAYANSIAHGHGFRLTPGASPVEGYSNPIEVMSLVPFALAHVDLDVAAKGVNVGFVALGLLGWGLFLWRNLRGLARLFAILPCVVTLLWPTFNYWTTAGLEGGILAGLQMLVLLALIALLAGRRGDWILGLVAGLLALTRPEGAVYGGLAIAAGLIRRPRRWKAGAVFVGCCVLLLLVRFALFRDLVPNTYWAKVSDGDLWAAGRRYVDEFFGAHGKRYFLVLLPLLIPFASRARIPALAALAQLAFALFFACHVGGDWMKQWRFMQFLQGPATAMVALGTYAALAPKVVLLGRIPMLIRVALAVGLLWPTVDNQRPLDGWQAREKAVNQRRDLDMRKIAICAGYYRDLGERLRLGRRLLVADIDVGGMSYPPGLDVLDLGGLADRVVGKQWTRQPSVIVDYLFGERRPDTIHLHGSWLGRRPVHEFSLFRLDYREMGNLFLHEMRLGPLTAIRADLLDPPAAPMKAVVANLGAVAIEGVSSFSDGQRTVVFLHATTGGPALPILRWLDADGKGTGVAWHSGADVGVGPAGSALLGYAVFAEVKLPLRLEGAPVTLDELPMLSLDTDNLLSLSRQPLLRLGGFYSPPCHPDQVLDAQAPVAARARGLALLAQLCGPGLSPETRERAARDLWRQVGRVSDPNDRYDTAAALSALAVAPSIGQRMAIEKARSKHAALDEVALAWAGRELAAIPPEPGAIERGLGILVAAREYGRVLTTIFARGWASRPEAQPALCAAARAVGLKAGALGRIDCASVALPAVRIARQDFEDAKDSSLHFVGAAAHWINQGASPNVVGGSGQRRLATAVEKHAPSTAGELVWGPLPWAGARFGALLAGAAPGAFLVVEGNDGRAWVELARMTPSSREVMKPQIALLANRGFREVRVRVVDPSKQGGLVVDSLAFIAP
jgi:hypothetical protein